MRGESKDKKAPKEAKTHTAVRIQAMRVDHVNCYSGTEDEVEKLEFEEDEVEITEIEHDLFCICQALIDFNSYIECLERKKQVTGPLPIEGEYHVQIYGSIKALMVELEEWLKRLGLM